jgi:hypothetical protein
MVALANYTSFTMNLVFEREIPERRKKEKKEKGDIPSLGIYFVQTTVKY